MTPCTPARWVQLVVICMTLLSTGAQRCYVLKGGKRIKASCTEEHNQKHVEMSDLNRATQYQREHQVFSHAQRQMTFGRSTVDAMKVSAKGVKKKMYKNRLGMPDKERYDMKHTPRDYDSEGNTFGYGVEGLSATRAKTLKYDPIKEKHVMGRDQKNKFPWMTKHKTRDQYLKKQEKKLRSEAKGSGAEDGGGTEGEEFSGEITSKSTHEKSAKYPLLEAKMAAEGKVLKEGVTDEYKAAQEKKLKKEKKMAAETFEPASVPKGYLKPDPQCYSAVNGEAAEPSIRESSKGPFQDEGVDVTPSKNLRDDISKVLSPQTFRCMLATQRCMYEVGHSGQREAMQRKKTLKFPNLPYDGFGTCAMVGYGHTLYQKGWGKDIDAHDTVFRFNTPIAGYERDVGTKTDVMMVIPGTDPKSLPKASRFYMYVGEEGGWSHNKLKSSKVDLSHTNLLAQGPDVEAFTKAADHMYMQYMDDKGFCPPSAVAANLCGDKLMPKKGYNHEVKFKRRGVYKSHAHGRQPYHPSPAFKRAIAVIDSGLCRRVDLYGFGGGGRYWDRDPMAGMNIMPLEHYVYRQMMSERKGRMCIYGD